MPQTLYKAKYLLKSEGHINIADYLDARQADAEAEAVIAPTSYQHLNNDRAGKYAHLVQPSTSLMKRNTRKSGRFVNLNVVKAEVMQPLLRDFGFKRGREAREEIVRF